MPKVDEIVTLRIVLTTIAVFRGTLPHSGSALKMFTQENQRVHCFSFDRLGRTLLASCRLRGPCARSPFDSSASPRAVPHEDQARMVGLGFLQAAERQQDPVLRPARDATIRSALV